MKVVKSVMVVKEGTTGLSHWLCHGLGAAKGGSCG